MRLVLFLCLVFGLPRMTREEARRIWVPSAPKPLEEVDRLRLEDGNCIVILLPQENAPDLELELWSCGGAWHGPHREYPSNQVPGNWRRKVKR